MKFFFDNNLASKIARGLNAFVSPEHEVVHLTDEFAPNTEDTVWMSELASQPGCIIITADLRIGRNPHEIMAWKQAGHTIFFLKPGWLRMKFWDQAYKFVKAFPEIIQAATGAQRGSSFLIAVSGKIEA